MGISIQRRIVLAKNTLFAYYVLHHGDFTSLLPTKNKPARALEPTPCDFQEAKGI